jgi:SPP1 family predicted phage head-tail adaptor
LTARHAYHFDTAYRTDLLPTMTLEYRGKTLQIHTVVDDDARKKRLILYCSEVQ